MEINFRYTSLLITTLLILFRYKYLFLILAFPSIFFSIYFIIGIDIGPLKYDYIAAVANTSFDESMSFFKPKNKKYILIIFYLYFSLY